MRSPRLLLAFVALLSLAVPAVAVIARPIALRDALDLQDLIFTAEVTAVDADKPSAVFAVGPELKGKCGLEKIALNLTATATVGIKDKHTEILLARLAKGRKLVLFAKKTGETYQAMAFTDGTWFSLHGAVDKDGTTVRWSFLNCEPNLRGTFSGTTDELIKVSTDVLAGKAKAPEPDLKAKPGYGPPVEVEKKEKQVGSGPLFGVIPSAFFVAPMAVLAAIFPATFGGLASGFKRWRAFMTVVSINGILAAVFFFAQPHLPNAWWASSTAFTVLLLLVVAAGLVWSGYRYRTAAAEDPTVTHAPTRRDLLAVLGFAAASVLLVLLVAVVTNWIQTKNLFSLRLADLARLLFELPARELTAAIVGLFVAAGYLAYRMLTARADNLNEPVRISSPGESVALGTMIVFGVGVLVLGLAPHAPATGTAAETTDGIELHDAGILFETNELTEPMSGVAVAGDRLYFGGAMSQGFIRSAALICVDCTTGKKLWSYTDPQLKTVYSTPVVADGRVYFGEGLHTDPYCRFLCVAADKPELIWAKPTSSHTEGTPVVQDGKVYFSAGDDGLFCVNAADGGEVWHYRGKEQGLHIDTSVTLANGRLYAGSGYQTLAAFCLDAATGNEVWKTPTKLRSFGQPVVVGGKVVYGLGTGNLSFDTSVEDEPGKEPERKPAGQVVAFDAATGKEVWTFDLPFSTHTQLAADGRAVYASCRDGWVYALDHATGRKLWRFSYGVPMTTGVAVVGGSPGVRGSRAESVFVVTPDGRVAAHDPLTGKVQWERSIAEFTGREAEVFAGATVLLDSPDPSGRTILIPAALKNRNNRAATAAVLKFVDRTAGDELSRGSPGR